MEAINPVRVMLFWDSKIASDTYGPYFTGVVRKKLDIANEPKYFIDIDPNLSNVRMTMRVPSYYEVHLPSITMTMRLIDRTEMMPFSSQSESDDDNDLEEGEFQTPLNPVNPVNSITENIVPQWESSQWFSSARYDYTHSGAFLDMGSSSPIDDLVESSNVRLLDWNDSVLPYNYA
ncbi:hypothetical protein M9H77_27645 [Catharanthus roseus]|uniref:Uncharacterized protein n=1 Tax=Catharanthus roseus TaxID=4058 RepID=A0ACC0AEI9_CATRO|nr:hypothetical protein M9H77_27645 [Catharanthus roseus]